METEVLESEKGEYIEVRMDNPNFDIALQEAVKGYKKHLDDNDDNPELWNVSFSLISVTVDSNFRRNEYTYVFFIKRS